MVDWQNRSVTTLGPNDVFVFGSNAQGFHGAGAAGLACRGDYRNNWRQDQWFLDAIAGKNDGIGKWANLGVPRGHQLGWHGQSYAIQTVSRPGARCSIGRRDIYAQLVDLWEFARIHTHLTFSVTPLGEGYAGYSPVEMNQVWEYLIATHGERTNVRFVRPSRTNYT